MEYINIKIPVDEVTTEGIKKWFTNLLDSREQKPNSAIEKDKNEILDVHGACNFLKIAPPTLYSYTSNNRIPYFKRGKKLYFRKSELEAWIEEGRHKTAWDIKNEGFSRRSK